MAMKVEPIPTASDRINEIRGLTARIVNDEILPNENMLWASTIDGQVMTDADRREARELRESIKEKVRQAGLWAPHLPEDYGGAGLSFLEHAYMNEVLAYAVGAASLFGVVAPNSGNQSILVNQTTDVRDSLARVALVAVQVDLCCRSSHSQGGGQTGSCSSTVGKWRVGATPVLVDTGRSGQAGGSEAVSRSGALDALPLVRDRSSWPLTRSS